MEAAELAIRTKLWVTHPCYGKYCDDGELQCGAVSPPIDFLRDDWLSLTSKIAKHSVEQVIAGVEEGKKIGRGEVVDSFLVAEIHSNPHSALKAFQKVLKEWHAKLKDGG